MYGICIYEDFYNYIYGKRIYIDRATVKDIGRHEWYSLLHEFVGALVIDRRNGIAVDTLYMELVELFPWIFSEDTAAVQDQLEKILDTYRQGGKGGLQKVEMTKEDRGYFKNGVKTLCGTELILATKVINDPDIKKMFTQGDLDFMNKELGRRAGAIFAGILRGFKKKDFAEVQKILTGGKEE